MQNCCDQAECVELAKKSCTKTHACGHACYGVRDEETCLPCLHGCAGAAGTATKLTQDHEDQCMICFTGALSEAPCMQSPCGHVFHAHCVRALLQARWSGPRVAFGFCKCAVCASYVTLAVLSVVMVASQADLAHACAWVRPPGRGCRRSSTRRSRT